MNIPGASSKAFDQTTANRTMLRISYPRSVGACLQAIPLPLRASSTGPCPLPSAFIACKHAPTSILAGASSGVSDPLRNKNSPHSHVISAPTSSRQFHIPGVGACLQAIPLPHSSPSACPFSQRNTAPLPAFIACKHAPTSILAGTSSGVSDPLPTN